MNTQLRKWTSLSFVLLIGYTATTTWATTPPLLPEKSVQLETDAGPVIVVSHQPEALPNAADYHVKISDLDTNSDNRLSRREIPKSHALASEFHLVDRNHDGYITAAELANWH